MTINHTTPSEVIQSLQIKLDEQAALIDRLRAALRECHHHISVGETSPDQEYFDRLCAELQKVKEYNRDLVSVYCSPPPGEASPTEIAKFIIAGFPNWRAVTLKLVFHAMEERK